MGILCQLVGSGITPAHCGHVGLRFSATRSRSVFRAAGNASGGACYKKAGTSNFKHRRMLFSIFYLSKHHDFQERTGGLV